MSGVRDGFFRNIIAVFKFIIFWVLILVQLPIILLLPRRAGVRYMRVFMWLFIRLCGIRISVHGELDSRRPLLVVCNHISVFEIATFPVAFGGSFVAKKEMESWPIVGFVSKKFGVVFVDRRPSHAAEALAVVQRAVKSVSYPMFVFPEGTSTNGAYVKQFKSSLFNFVENSDVTVQPMVMCYRYRDGSAIGDIDMANHYAYFNNRDMEYGPRCERERSAFAQVFHIMKIGGFVVDITVLPPVDVRGMNRKEIASHLHKIVSTKYMEIKDKQGQ